MSQRLFETGMHSHSIKIKNVAMHQNQVFTRHPFLFLASDLDLDPKINPHLYICPETLVQK